MIFPYNLLSTASKAEDLKHRAFMNDANLSEIQKSVCPCHPLLRGLLEQTMTTATEYATGKVGPAVNRG